MISSRSEIGCQRMVRITAQHRLQERFCSSPRAQTELCLGLKKECRRLLPKLKVIIEQQHRGQRGGEIFDPGWHILKPLRVGEQILEQVLRFLSLAKLLPG